MLTVVRLKLPMPLRRSLACTNAIANMMGTVRRVSRNVKRWRNAAMALRWTAAGMITVFASILFGYLWLFHYSSTGSWSFHHDRAWLYVTKVYIMPQEYGARAKPCRRGLHSLCGYHDREIVRKEEPNLISCPWDPTSVKQHNQCPWRA
jgi:hypothetical protein